MPPQAIVKAPHVSGTKEIKRQERQCKYIARYNCPKGRPPVTLIRSARYQHAELKVEDIPEFAKNWFLQSGNYNLGQHKEESDQEITRHTIVSFPTGADRDAAEDTVYEWAQKLCDPTLDSEDPVVGYTDVTVPYDYYMGFHEDTDNLHAHVVILRRALESVVRIEPRPGQTPDDRPWLKWSNRNLRFNNDRARRLLVECAAPRGILMEATSRAERGLPPTTETTSQYYQRLRDCPPERDILVVCDDHPEVADTGHDRLRQTTLTEFQDISVIAGPSNATHHLNNTDNLSTQTIGGPNLQRKRDTEDRPGSEADLPSPKRIRRSYAQDAAGSPASSHGNLTNDRLNSQRSHWDAQLSEHVSSHGGNDDILLADHSEVEISRSPSEQPTHGPYDLTARDAHPVLTRHDPTAEKPKRRIRTRGDRIRSKKERIDVQLQRINGKPSTHAMELRKTRAKEAHQRKMTQRREQLIASQQLTERNVELQTMQDKPSMHAMELRKTPAREAQGRAGKSIGPRSHKRRTNR